MSFLYKDTDLLNKLIKAAQDSNPDPKNKEYLDLAKTLVKNLQNQMSGKDVFTSERDNTALSTKHLVDLDSLLFFLNFNGIKHNGSQIVINNTRESMRNTEEGVAYYNDLAKKGYDKYPLNEAIPKYYVLKNGLISYLRDLQSKNNTILNPFLSKLIDSVNNELKFEVSKEPDKTIQPDGRTKPSPQAASSTAPPGVNPIPDGSVISTKQVLEQITELLPFDNDDISFDRINKFFTLYNNLIAGPNIASERKSNVTNAMQQAINSMNVAKQHTIRPMSTYPLYGLNPNIIATWLKPPQGQHYDSLLQALISVIGSTEYVVRDLYNTYARRPSEKSRVTLESNQENLIQQQVVGNSIYLSNLKLLQTMALRLGEIRK